MRGPSSTRDSCPCRLAPSVFAWTHVAAVTLALLLVGGCAAPWVEVSRDRDADFSAYRTFGFRDRNLSSPGRSTSDGAQVLDLLRAATAAELKRLGYTRSETPDLIVDLRAWREDKVSTHYTDLGDIVSRGSETVLEVEVLDSARGLTAAWSGRRTAQDSGWARRNPQKAIARSIGELLAAFPPAVPGPAAN